MKRDWEVIRNLLLLIESSPGSLSSRYDQAFDLIESDVFAYHCWLLIDGGFATGSAGYKSNGTPSGNIQGLTFKGQDFLDLIRDESRWEGVTRAFAMADVRPTYDLLKSELEKAAAL
jgi:hypothetical protein